MVFSVYEWIACGGVLLPVGHWVFQTQLKKRAESKFVTHEKPFVYREFFEHQMISAITLQSTHFKQSSLPPYRIAISEEASAVKQVFASSAPQFVSELKGPLKYPVEVHTYKFPKGYVACPTTKLIASSRDTLLKDVLQIQKGKTVLVAGVSLTLVGVSWLFYGMTPEKGTEPMLDRKSVV
jgi:hypothetical protein